MELSLLSSWKSSSDTVTAATVAVKKAEDAIKSAEAANSASAQA